MSKDLREYDLNDMLVRAEEAVACPGALDELRIFESVADLIDRAPEHRLAFWAYWYALFVLKGPWPEAEATIAKDADAAYRYARIVLKRPWPEAEAAIAKDADAAYCYARTVLEGPWPEAEAAIAKDSYWGREYADFIGSSRTEI